MHQLLSRNQEIVNSTECQTLLYFQQINWERKQKRNITSASFSLYLPFPCFQNFLTLIRDYSENLNQNGSRIWQTVFNKTYVQIELVLLRKMFLYLRWWLVCAICLVWSLRMNAESHILLHEANPEIATNRINSQGAIIVATSREWKRPLCCYFVQVERLATLCQFIQFLAIFSFLASCRNL